MDKRELEEVLLTKCVDKDSRNKADLVFKHNRDCFGRVKKKRRRRAVP